MGSLLTDYYGFYEFKFHLCGGRSINFEVLVHMNCLSLLMKGLGKFVYILCSLLYELL